jgi:hypothetical protein
MKILIATTNEDKFRIVRAMVEDVIPDAYLISLKEAKLDGDVVEVGTMAERAVQKAKYFEERAEWYGRGNEFDAIMAIDDGLSIQSQEARPNSKELTDRILLGEWPVGSPVGVVRAFALIKRGELPRVELTTVPFTFVGNPSNLKREGGKYPLSRVLAPFGMERPVIELSTQEENAFNLSHSAEALKRLFS